MKRRSRSERYAMLPRSVLESEAWRTLPYFAMAVLVAIAAQYNGQNNGDLALSWAMAQRFGIRSHNHHVAALRLLLERGLIEKTLQGGMRPLGPTLYAVTWHPIDRREGGYDFAEQSETASRAFENWQPIGTAGGPLKKNQRDRRRTGSGPRAVLLEPLTGPPADHKRRFIGTAGGPPSRYTRSSRPHRRGNGSGGAPC